MSNRNRDGDLEEYGVDFVDRILELDEMDYIDDEEDLASVIPEWSKEWAGIRHLRDMPEDWFMVAGMRRVTAPISRFSSSENARKWFTNKYNVVCCCHSARFWCCVVRDKEPTTEKDNKK